MKSVVHFSAMRKSVCIALEPGLPGQYWTSKVMPLEDLQPEHQLSFVVVEVKQSVERDMMSVQEEVLSTGVHAEMATGLDN